MKGAENLCSYRRKWDSLPTLASVTFMSLTPRGVEGHCWWSQSAVWVSRHFPLLETLSTSRGTLHFSRHSPLLETLSTSRDTLHFSRHSPLLETLSTSRDTLILFQEASWFPVANWRRPGPWRCSSCLGHVLRALELAEAVPRPFLLVDGDCRLWENSIYLVTMLVWSLLRLASQHDQWGVSASRTPAPARLWTPCQQGLHSFC